jgi:hypothetical protein
MLFWVEEVQCDERRKPEITTARRLSLITIPTRDEASHANHSRRQAALADEARVISYIPPSVAT